MKGFDFVIFGFFGVFLLLAGYFVGQNSATKGEQTRAIKAGVARYTVDPATGITKFEYVKP